MACWHRGLKRVGSVMKRLRIYSWPGVSCSAIDLRTILTRVLDAGFFLRIADQSLLMHHLI